MLKIRCSVANNNVNDHIYGLFQEFSVIFNEIVFAVHALDRLIS